MIDDIIYIVFLALEVAILVFFIFYIGKYLKEYQVKVDPYTNATLILLVISFIFQFMRVPLTIMEMIVEHSDDPNSDFNIWYKANVSNTGLALKIIVFCHGNI
jgi:hypothetical protein